MFTKKCPYCAEKIQSKAIVCKFCHKELSAKKVHILQKSFITLVNENTEKRRVQEQEKMALMTEDEKKLYSAKKAYENKVVVFWLVLIVVTFSLSANYGYWALLAPMAACWLYPLRNEKVFQNRIVNFKKHKARSIISLVLIVVMLGGLTTQLWQNMQDNAQQEQNAKLQATQQALYDAAPKPTITVLSKTGNQGKTTEYLLKFTTTNADTAKVASVVASYYETVQPDNNGVFSTKIPLNNLSTTIHIVASNKYKSAQQDLEMTRDKTDQEVKIEEANKLALQKDMQEAEKKQQAYEKSPAGRLCKKHSDWSEDDCDMVAKNLIWIGMTLDMLKAERGNPSSTNVSNYGAGDQYQWCWYNWHDGPSCFYGGPDGITTSYN